MVEWIGAMKDAVTVAKVLGRETKDLATALGGPIEDASNKAGFSIEDLGKKIFTTNLRFVALGPVLTAASIAVDKFGLSAAQAVPDVEALAASVGHITDAVDRAAADRPEGPEGLNVQRILNRVTGFDAQQVRARIRGDTNALISSLEEEREFLEAQLQRVAVQRRPELVRQLESDLLGVVNELSRIREEGARDATQRSEDAARAEREAAQDLIAQLASNRARFQEAISAAAEQGASLTTQIRLQAEFSDKLRQQIAIINKLVKDEQAKKDALRQLGAAVRASEREEDALRAERARERAARRDELQNLEIEIAQETGNQARLRRALEARIRTLREQIENAKKDRVLRKQLQLELAQRTNDLKELKDEAKQANNRQRELEFEFLQAQQGFAANLFGNLIPTGAAGGLVGNVSATAPPAPVDRGIPLAIQRAEARDQGGFTAGQGNSVIAVLLRIERGIRELNRESDSPEARYQRRVGSAAMDGAGAGNMSGVQQ
jgi:hypothetical protein